MIVNCKNQKRKSSTWLILIYEESVKENYIEILRSQQIRCVISPLHDKDLNEDGTPQKPHRHILIKFNGGRRLQDVDYIIETINAYQHCEISMDPLKSFEYLWHKNEPDKYHYNENDLIFINSNKSDFIFLPYRDIAVYIKENDLLTFNKLVDTLIANEDHKLLEYVSANCYYVQSYQKAIKDKQDYQISQDINMIKHYLDIIAQYCDEDSVFMEMYKRYNK